MIRAKCAWVWNKKFTVSRTTKVVGATNRVARPIPVSSSTLNRQGPERRRRFVCARASAPVEQEEEVKSGANLNGSFLDDEVLREIERGIAADLGLGDPSRPEETSALLRRLVRAGSSENDDEGEKFERTDERRVPGCASRVWLSAEVVDASGGLVCFRGDSDSAVSRGLCASLCRNFSGKLTPSEFLSLGSDFLKRVTADVDPILAGSHHRHGLHSIFDSMRKRANELTLADGAIPEPFPSLVVTAKGLHPKGAYAESQARYLEPDPARVRRLVDLLRETKCGVVAHFYMDPEVQGVLAAAKRDWPHIHISDSLVMADRAVDMVAEGGCEKICVLGVDFMSENVRATLDHQGHRDVGVFRMAADLIGCTLAEAAEAEGYSRYLEEAEKSSENSLHVVYINTSLKTKALAQHQVPTITCTSSNVVQTILQSSSQLKGDLSVFYGPDAYMGANIAEMLARLAQMTDEEVQKVHPKHDASSIKNLLSRFRYYGDGICVVHDMFGAEVADTIERCYSDAYLTAHFEVPGEMFGLALRASHRGGRGVIGSTQNILDFILSKVQESVSHDLSSERLQFVLGTESGMITSVVNSVQDLLRQAGSPVEVEIVFPVNSSAVVTGVQDAAPAMPWGLNVVPGVAQGEGCGMEGGCASCPYMKMNSLDSLLGVLEMLRGGGKDSDAVLQQLEPRKYSETVGGKTFAEVGTVPILHMRHFQKNKELSGELVADILARGRGN